MPTNDFLPFCETDTGTNLLSESDYIASADRTSGNKPGVASSKLNNKAIRQATAIVSNFAQYLSNITNSDVLDDANDIKLLAQMNSALMNFKPTFRKYTSGTGTHNLAYIFAIASGNATVGATYTNNTVTFTVLETIAAGLFLKASGGGAPTVNGTLTKASGTGDSTLTFYAVRAPLYLKVQVVAGGGGGSGGGLSGAGAGGSGANSSFGTSLIVSGGGVGGTFQGVGGSGGTATLGTGPVGTAMIGNCAGSSLSPNSQGPAGAAGPFGGAGLGGFGGNAGVQDAPANSGAGGGGAGVASASHTPGVGGGAGGFVDAIIFSPLSTYPFVVGAGGVAGTAGSGSGAGVGSAGGSGVINVEDCYQ